LVEKDYSAGDLESPAELARQKFISEFIESYPPAFRLKSLFLWLRKTAKHFLS
jgi:hypothetical protein